MGMKDDVLTRMDEPMGMHRRFGHIVSMDVRSKTARMYRANDGNIRKG